MPDYNKLSNLIISARKRNLSLGRAVLEDECEESHLDRDAALNKMKKQILVMRQAVEAASSQSVEGPLYFKDAWMMQEGIKRKLIPKDLTALAVQKAVAINAWNSLNGKVVATPTGGSCGILPGVLLAAQEQWDCSDEEVALAMFAGGGTGIPIALNGTLSGSVGGCQAECGSAACMAAAAMTDLSGASAEQCIEAFAIACKASMGLICDPIGNVACPCVKRNGLFAGVAISAAYMAICGVKSIIPPDDMLRSFCDVSLDVAKKFSRLDGDVGIQKTEFAQKLDFQ